MRYALTDMEWKFIQPILPCKPRRVKRVDDRRVLNGIFWILRSGAPWRDLPNCFGPYTTCYNRFIRWQRAGVWDDVLEAISNHQDADVQMIDSSIIRVHQHGACIKQSVDNCTGRSRGGLTTKPIKAKNMQIMIIPTGITIWWICGITISRTAGISFLIS